MIHWIEHAGDGLPVPATCHVIAERRDGSKAGAAAGEMYGWDHFGVGGDIVRFSCNPDDIYAQFVPATPKEPS